MKGRLTDDGRLEIYRKNAYIEQQCPMTHELYRCGAWCPLFGEPLMFSFDESHGAIIKICQHHELYFEEFKDERV